MFMTQTVEKERRHSDASSNTNAQSPATQRQLLYVAGFNKDPNFDRVCVYDGCSKACSDSTVSELYLAINCRTQLICLGQMFITQLSTTCFGAYGHLQVDELTKNIYKQLHLACVFYTEDGGRG